MGETQNKENFSLENKAELNYLNFFIFAAPLLTSPVEVHLLNEQINLNCFNRTTKKEPIHSN